MIPFSSHVDNLNMGSACLILESISLTVKGLDTQQTGTRYLYEPTFPRFNYPGKCNQDCWPGRQACRVLNFVKGRRTHGVQNSVGLGRLR